MRKPPANPRRQLLKRVQEPGTCEGPDVMAMKRMIEWEAGNFDRCPLACHACVMSAGTVVRVIQRARLEGGPDWLKERESTWLRGQCPPLPGALEVTQPETLHLLRAPLPDSNHQGHVCPGGHAEVPQESLMLINSSFTSFTSFEQLNQNCW